jgi:hypothetical protein
MRGRSLPRLIIQVPCPADWRSMEPIAGDSRARLCRRCDKPVYDSRAMSRDELLALIARTEGSPPCLQLHQRPDGTVVTKDCLAALYRTARFLWIRTAALAVAFWASVVGLRRVCDTATASRPTSLEITESPSLVLGGMVSVVREPRRRRALRRAPEPARTTADQPLLQHLQSEEDLLPPGWND